MSTPKSGDSSAIQEIEMVSKLKMLAVSVVFAGLGAVLSATPATAGQAAGPLANPRCDTDTWNCATRYEWFTGGTISIDADVLGGGTAQWQLYDGSQRVVCSTYFPAIDPPRSWICNNVAAGNVSLFVQELSHTAVATHGGLRW
ncbi:hypothetical protein [Amycolatopsis coloradensis]|nr:hypothetical protein [Amycolatopsis coloradensis]